MKSQTAPLSMDQFLFNHFSQNDQKLASPQELEKLYETARKNPQEIKTEVELDYHEAEGFYRYMECVVKTEKNGDAKQQANQLHILLGDTRLIMKYLKVFCNQHPHARTPIHDACSFVLPTKELAFWQKLAKNHLIEPLFVTALARADEIVKHPSFHSQMGIQDVLNILPKLTYGEFPEKYQEAANVFQKYRVPAEAFKQYQRLKPVDDDKQIPNVSIKFKDYTIEKLSSSDPHAAILGYITGCCQSLGREGGACAEYGITQANSGFYVVRNKRGDIIAQTWAWRDNDTIVFDSIEPNSAAFENKQTTLIALFRKLAETIATKAQVDVLVGTGGRTPDLFGIETYYSLENERRPPGYHGYTDSQEKRAVTLAFTDLCVIAKLPSHLTEDKLINHLSALTRKQLKMVAYYLHGKEDNAELWARFFALWARKQIHSAHGLRETFQLFNPDQYKEIFSKVKALPHFRVIIKDFQDILNNLTPKRFAIIFNIIKDELPAVIDSAERFKLTTARLTEEQRTQVYLAVKHHLFSLDLSPIDFKHIANYLTTEQKNEVYEAIKEQLFNKIKTADQLHAVLTYLNETQCSEFCERLSHRWQQILPTATDLHVACNTLSHAKCNIIYNNFKGSLPAEFIQSINGFIQLMEHFSVEFIMPLYQMFQDKLPTMISVATNRELAFLMRTFPYQENPAILAALTKRLHSIKPDDLYEFSDKACAKIFMMIKEELPKHIRYPGDVAKIFRHLSDEERMEIFPILRQRIAELIPRYSSFGFTTIVEHLPAKLRHEVFVMFRPLVPKLNSFSLRSDHFNTSERIILCNEVKGLNSLPINSLPLLTSVLSECTAEARAIVLRNLTGHWHEIINFDINNLHSLLRMLSETESTVVLHELKNHLFQISYTSTNREKILETANDILKHLSLEDCAIVWNNPLGSIPHSMDDVNRILQDLPPEKRKIIYQSLNDRWQHLIGNDLRNCYFTNTSFKNVNFTGVDARQAIFVNVDFSEARGLHAKTFKDAWLRNITVKLSPSEIKQYETLWNECKAGTTESPMHRFIRKTYPTNGTFLFFHRRSCADSVRNHLRDATDEADLFARLKTVNVNNINGKFVKVFTFLKQKMAEQHPACKLETSLSPMQKRG